MLVHFRRGEETEVEHFAGVQHSMRERRQFFASHPAQDYRHQPGSNLVVRDVAGGVTVDDVGDFSGRQCTAIALFADEVDNAKRLHNTWLAHLRRKPSGRSSVMWPCLGPSLP